MCPFLYFRKTHSLKWPHYLRVNLPLVNRCTAAFAKSLNSCALSGVVLKSFIFSLYRWCVSLFNLCVHVTLCPDPLLWLQIPPAFVLVPSPPPPHFSHLCPQIPSDVTESSLVIFVSSTSLTCFLIFFSLFLFFLYILMKWLTAVIKKNNIF